MTTLQRIAAAEAKRELQAEHQSSLPSVPTVSDLAQQLQGLSGMDDMIIEVEATESPDGQRNVKMRVRCYKLGRK